MKYLALKFPGGQVVSPPDQFNTTTFHSLSSTVSAFLNVIFYITGFLMFFWLVWGVFQYIFAGGDKEKLSAAKKRITYAIVGFLLVAIAFSVSTWAQQLLNPSSPNIHNVTPPGNI